MEQGEELGESYRSKDKNEEVQVNECLEGSYTDDGIRRWWDRPRPSALGGRTPRQAWNDGDKELVKQLAYSLTKPMQ